jgi:hypothetical protein
VTFFNFINTVYTVSHLLVYSDSFVYVLMASVCSVVAASVYATCGLGSSSDNSIVNGFV